MIKKKSKQTKNDVWGIWLINQKSWLEDKDRKPASYKLKREAQKECDEFNNAWKGRKKSYEVKKLQ
ncbi:hypothetical protein CMI47_01930 [Candidatus Pacearchaeota archaeon]|nr:hypothetical protein [Candidatus Pacearchaeota archaeon]